MSGSEAEGGATARLFFAVLLAPELRDAVAGIQERLRATRARVKWVEPQNLHFTMKFLGETPEGLTRRLVEVARDVAARHVAFPLEVGGVGAFPRAAEPRVVWVGCGAGAAALEALAADLDAALARERLSSPEQRPFKAHLTVGRARDPREARDLEPVLRDEARAAVGLMQVTHLALMRSELRREGPVYAEVARAELGG
jgi:RNA 2',3'-cyclic 3'-phosphodiesterase